MILYILKFSACLLIFQIFYKLFLEKESIHKFKRFYLLLGLIIAAIIPIISFTTYIFQPVENAVLDTSLPLAEAIEPLTEMYKTDWLVIVLWSIYGVGVLLFSWNFLTNLFQLKSQIKNNPKVKFSDFTNVLVNRLKVPYTFLSYIFVNKFDFEDNLIPKEVLLHEQAHAKQKHTLDILFIEIIQIIFWFNPLLLWLKKDIKQNHEYLADTEVLNNGVELSFYQELLLSFSNQPQNSLANAINYSSIKKRFTLMKTQTSKQRLWLKTTLVLPLLAVLVYGFSQTKTEIKTLEHENNKATKISEGDPNILGVQNIYNPSFLEYIVEMEKEGASFYLDHKKISAKEAKSIAKNNNGARTEMITQKDTQGNYMVKLSSAQKDKLYARSVELTIINDNSYVIDGIEATKKTFLNVFNQLHQDITSETRKKILNIHVSSSDEISNKNIWFIYNSLQDYGFYRIVTPNQEINRAKGNTPYAISNIQDGATKAQLKEYNTIVDKINKQSKEQYPIIKMKDLEKIKYIYSIMSADQKKTARPFPEIPQAPLIPPAPKQVKKTPKPTKIEVKQVPPPPPPPPAPENATPEQKAKYEKYHKEYKERMSKGKMKKNSAEIEEIAPPPPPPIPADATEEEKRRYKKIIADYAKKHPKSKTKFKDKSGKVVEVVEVPASVLEVPPPPPPVSIEKLAKEGATFYYEGKKISAKEALKLSNAKSPKHIEFKNINGVKEVYIYKNPKKKVKQQASNTNKSPWTINVGVESVVDLSEMIKKNATFYYNDHEISSKEALKVVKSKGEFKIKTEGEDTAQPKVYIWDTK